MDLNRTDKIIKESQRALRLAKRKSKRIVGSEVISSKIANREIAQFIEAGAILNSKTLLKLPKNKIQLASKKLLECEFLLLRINFIRNSLSSAPLLRNLDSDFFTPFSVSWDIDDLVELVRSASKNEGNKLRRIVFADIEKGLIVAEKKVKDKFQRIAKKSKHLPSIFWSDGLAIERSILAFVDNKIRIEARNSYRSKSVVRLGGVIEEMITVFPESKVRSALMPGSQLFQENYLQVNLSELSEANWDDIYIKTSSLYPDEKSGLIEGTNLFQVEQLSIPTDSLDNIYLSNKDSSDVRGLISLYKKKKLTSLSILLHGPSGTGKSSLARAIAHELGLKVVTVSSAGMKQDQLPYIVSYLTKKYCQGALIFFDECESLWYGEHSWLFGSDAVNSEKGALKQILEKISGVTVYASNVSPPLAFRRRVSCVIEMKRPDVKIRAKILAREIESFSKDTGCLHSLSSSQTFELAERHDLAGGFFRQALSMAAARSGGQMDFPIIDQVLREISLSQDTLDGIRRASISVSDLVLPKEMIHQVDRIVSISEGHLNNSNLSPLMPQGVTVLLEGPSGTGKTVLAEAIANRLGLRFRRVTPSTFLSKYVGDTEKQIRRVLKEASDEKYLLFLDEAEGMLSARDTAKANWEMTQINEWLNCIEQFGGIFIAATNHKELMDPAFGRRFLFKIQFRYPTAEERLKFLEKHLIGELSPQTLQRIADDYEVSFGELRNALVQLRTFPRFDQALLEQIVQEQLLGRSGYLGRRIGI